MKNPLTTFFVNRRARKRDYAAARQRAANPMFTVERRPSLGGPLAVILLVVILGAGLYSLFTPALRITEVRVVGATKVDRASVERFVESRLNRGLLGLQWQRVDFLTPTESLAQELQARVEKLLSVERVTVKRQGRHALVVTLTERTPHLIWQTDAGSNYSLDDQGYVVERLSGQPPEGFPIIHDANRLDSGVGRQVLLPRFIAALNVLRERLPSFNVTPKDFTTWEVSCQPPIATEDTSNANDNANVTASAPFNSNVININTGQLCDEAALALNDPTIVVNTTESWSIRFDSSGDLEQQLRKLSLSLNERLGDRRQSLDYIDVRFGDRVFYQ